MFTVSVGQLMSNTETRTTGFVGGGVTHEVRDRLSIQGAGLLGLDVFQRPLVALLPTAGLRAGATWYPRMPVVSSIGLSVTAMFDLASHSAGGVEIGGASVYATLSTGFGLSQSR